jgi:hypothetical protein
LMWDDWLIAPGVRNEKYPEINNTYIEPGGR